MKRENIPATRTRPHYSRTCKAGATSFQKKVRHAVQVSIIVPSLNQGNTIEAAIRSILDQGIDSLEIIVADGGSTDGTLQILEKLFIEVGSRIAWFSEADGGPAQAINKAIEMSKGAIVAWLNADDLHAGGAIGCVIRHLENHPDLLMLYGRANHIEDTGSISDEYPTLPAETPVETFRENCFICQPAVFLRRAVFAHVGKLDESLSAAYSLDLWLRIFKSCQSRVGHLPAVLAYSRQQTVAGTVQTISKRRRFALETTKTLGVHLGTASPKWLLAYFDMFFERYPFIALQGGATEDCIRLLEEARPSFSDAEAHKLHEAVRSDARFRVALPDAFITIHADGWAGSSGFMRVRFTGRQWKSLKLICRHAPPVPGTLTIEILLPWDTRPTIEISRPGAFEIEIPLPEQSVTPSYLSIPFICETSFVPSEEIAGSMDSRELSFIVEGLELLE